MGKKPVIWTGDLNVAVLNYDVYDGETNKARKKSSGFTDYERNFFLDFLTQENLVDAYREFYPDLRTKAQTFWTIRSGAKKKNPPLGWRLDYCVVSPSILPLIANIENPFECNISDHCPFIMHLANPNTRLSG